jgi:hypothetical protein
VDALSYKFVCGDVILFSLPPIAESPCECKIPVEYTCPESFRRKRKANESAKEKEKRLREEKL